MATAYANLYVDTDIGSAGDGTSWAQAKAGLAAAVALLDANTEHCTIHCKGTAADVLTGALGISATQMAATKVLTIQTDTADRHPGKWSTSHYRATITADIGDGILELSRGYVQVIGLQFAKTGAGAWGHLLTESADVADLFFESCILHQSPEDGFRFTAGTAIIRNCAIYRCGGSGVYTTWGAGKPDVTVQNCTFAKCDYGIRNIDADVAATNTYSGGCDTSDYTGTITFTTCASSDATARSGVTASIAHSVSAGAYFTNIGDGTEDYHIAATSDLYDAGTDLSGTFTTDIDGETRTTWDIGCDEVTAATSQFARPASTTASGSWDGFISGVEQDDEANLHDYVDEETASDTDTIRSGTNPVNDTCTLALDPLSTPEAGDVTIRWRARFVS